jgi:3,4-dihydroxy-2-butanone 4-phosphate synthase
MVAGAAHRADATAAGSVAGSAAPVAAAVVTGLSTVDEAVAAIAAGRPVIVADDEHRENEGDVVLAAELASPEWIAWTVAHSSGFICAPVSAAIADALDLPPMVAHNEDVRGTAYTVTVDAAVDVTTGISAHDRARTLRVLADPASRRDDLHRPGHVVPLRARPGGVRERAGHTEASIDLVTAAGLRPAAAICEIVGEDGSMMRLPGLVELGRREGVPVITIAALAEWLDAADRAGETPSTEGTTR